MKRLKTLAWILLGVLVLAPTIAYAQVATNYWIFSGGTLKPSLSSWSLTIPQLGGNGTQCVQVNNSGLFSTSGSGACGSGSGGGSFPFTPTPYGNSTSTTLGFLNGFLSGASSTITYLGTGGIGSNNGRLYGAATTTAGTGLTYDGTSFNVGGLTTSQFSSANISQWTNNSGYVTSSFSTTSASYWITATTSLPSITTLAGLTTIKSSFSGALAANAGVLYNFSTTSMNASITGSAGSVANALTINSPLTGSSYNGSSAVSIGCTAASGSATGCLSSTDWLTFNGKLGTSTTLTQGNLLYSSGSSNVTSVATTTVGVSGALTLTPNVGTLVGGSALTIKYTGLATTTAITQGQLFYSSGGAGVTNVATGTVAAGNGISVTASQAIIGTGLTITNSYGYPFTGVTSFGVTAATTTVLFPAGLAAGTSTIGSLVATSSFYNIGSTTLGTSLSGAGLSSCTGGTNALTWSGGMFGCNSITTSGGAFPFTPNPTYNGTSTTLGFTGGTGIFTTASSTLANNLFVGTSNVGIGQTSPGQKLDVNGNEIIEGTGGTLFASSTFQAITRNTNVNFNSALPGIAAGEEWIDGGQGSTNGPSAGISGGLIQFAPTNFNGYVANQYQTQILDTNSGSNQDFFLRNNVGGTWEDWYRFVLQDVTTGNVGIGTTTPGSILSIQGVANFVANAASTIYNDFKVLGNLYLPSLGTAAGSFLAVDPTGKVIATSTPSGGAGSTVTTYYATSTLSSSGITYVQVANIPVQAGYVVNWWINTNETADSGSGNGCSALSSPSTMLDMKANYIQATESASTTLSEAFNGMSKSTADRCTASTFASFTATTTTTITVSDDSTANAVSGTVRSNILVEVIH